MKTDPMTGSIDTELAQVASAKNGRRHNLGQIKYHLIRKTCDGNRASILFHICRHYNSTRSIRAQKKSELRQPNSPTNRGEKQKAQKTSDEGFGGVVEENRPHLLYKMNSEIRTRFFSKTAERIELKLDPNFLQGHFWVQPKFH